MVQCLIIEDDFAFAIEVKLMIEKFGYLVVGIEKEKEEIQHVLSNNSIDVIISDVKLGSDQYAFEYLKKMDNLPPVIFMSSYDEDDLYIESKKLNPVLYLKKPIDEITLRSALDTALRSSKTNVRIEDRSRSRSRVFIKHKGDMISVNPEKIIMIKSEGNHCEILTTKRKFVTRSSIKNLLNSINRDFLIQVHRGYIVNLNMISSFSIGKDEICIEDYIIPIGRTYKKGFKSLMK